MAKIELAPGAFATMLKRSNKQLREDRAENIVRNTKKQYRRRIEDMNDQIAQINEDRQNLLDINPGNTQTIINPSDFNTDEFIEKDIDYGVKLRNIQIKLEIALEQYRNLFGEEPVITD